MDEFDELRDHGGRPPRRPKKAGLAAVRLLLRRMDWLHWPLVWWTGQPAVADPLSATNALHRKLEKKPAGLFAVRFQKRTEADSFDNPPAVQDLVSVDESLIASALRRLLESRGFPKLLPKEVGDIATWEARCKTSLLRARAAINAKADLAALGDVCQIVGMRPDRPPGGRRRGPIAPDVLAALDDARLMGRNLDLLVHRRPAFLQVIALVQHAGLARKPEFDEPPILAKEREKQNGLVRSMLLTLWATGTIDADAAVRPWMLSLLEDWPVDRAAIQHAQVVASVLAEVARVPTPTGRAVLEDLLDRSINRLITHQSRGSASHLSCIVRHLHWLIARNVLPEDLEFLLERFNPWFLSHALTVERPETPSRQLVSDLRRLVEDLSGHPSEFDFGSLSRCGPIVDAVAALGRPLVGQFLQALRDFKLDLGDAVDCISRLGRQVMLERVDGQEGTSPTERARRREAMVGVLAVLRTHLRRVKAAQGDNALELLYALVDCVNLALAAEHIGWPSDTIAHRVKSFMAAFSRALPKGEWAQRPWGYRLTEMPEVLPLIQLARHDIERLTALGHGAADTDYQAREHLRVLWPVIEPMTGVTDAIANAVCRASKVKRGVDCLARLGLYVRLAGSAIATQRLTALAPRPAETPIERLRRLDPVGRFSGRIIEALDRPKKLASELDALLARPTLTASAQKRVARLRELLADAAGLASWVERDLARWLPEALADAVLGQLELIGSELFGGYFEKLLGTPLPTNLSPAEQRNWDNALRLYSGLRKNRSLLRRLLKTEARGDRDWIRSHPSNARFLAQIEARGIYVSTWLGPYAESVETPAGILKIEVETQPLHVLQMGNYFQTCLSEGNFNAFATVANAVELNKRVIYVYDPRGVVIGRKLVALTPTGQLVGFRTYGDLPGKRDDQQAWTKMRDLLVGFCRRWATAMHATLHPHPAGSELEKLNDEKPFRLLAEWYNDGPEAFEDPPEKPENEA